MSSKQTIAMKQGSLRRIRSLTHLLDNAIAIPGTKVRVGLDSLLGLFPGAGDWLSTVLSVYIVFEAMRFQLPRKTLTQMVSNLLLDLFGGSIPIAGDLFDVAWKANHRNLRLLEAHLQDQSPQKAANRWFVVLVVIILLALIVAVTSLVVLLGSWLTRLLQGG